MTGPPQAPVQQAVTPPASVQAEPAKVKPENKTAEMERAVNTARRQSVSTGVPTAASILAALEKVGSPGSTSATPITQPQQTPPAPSQPQAQAVPTGTAQPVVPTAPPVQMKSSSTGQDSNDQELELRRRAGQASTDPNRSIDQTVPLVALGPNAATDPDPARKSNPFLNPGKTGEEGPAATAKQLLDEAKTEAEKQGMVAPTVPVKASEETTDAARTPASTVPIPAQIKQLTDSIASFAKPIDRIQNPGNPTDF